MNQFNFSGIPGTIPYATALFGSPWFGEHLSGDLYFSEAKDGFESTPHCTRESYSNVDAFEKTLKEGNDKENGHTRMKYVVVRRGGCSFALKARVAEELGADAVIVVEHLGVYDERIQEEVLMIPDAYGRLTHVPTVMVTKKDGEKLIKFLMKGATIKGELDWDMPSNGVAVIDYWFDAIQHSDMFLEEFVPFALGLAHNVEFFPHYRIHSQQQDYYDECYDDDAKFCVEDPDQHGPITGKEVVSETLRQLCIWETHAHSLVKVHERHGLSVDEVRHAVHYWQYLALVKTRCPVDGPDNARFGSEQCSKNLMKELSINVDRVDTCIKDNWRNILFQQLYNTWTDMSGISSLRINGAILPGVIEAKQVAKAICSGYLNNNRPDACVQWKKVNFEISLTEFQWLHLFLIIVGALLVFAVVLYFLMTKVFIKHYRSVLQEEVMLTVNDHMNEYAANYAFMQDDNEQNVSKQGARMFGLPKIFSKKEKTPASTTSVNV